MITHCSLKWMTRQVFLPMMEEPKSKGLIFFYISFRYLTVVSVATYVVKYPREEPYITTGTDIMFTIYESVQL